MFCGPFSSQEFTVFASSNLSKVKGVHIK